MGARVEPAPRRRRRVAALLVGALALAACGTSAGAPEPASDQGETVLDLWRLNFWLAVVIGGFVLLLMLWAVVRYRRRPGDESLPPQFRANVPLEVVYTAVPAVIVAGLFAVGVMAQDEVFGEEDDPDLTVRVIGFQWQWEFWYPGGRVVDSGTLDRESVLVLPVDQDVRLELVTRDVIHSFFVPGFLEKRDLIPGVDNHIDITPTRTGEFVGHCAEFCGWNHAEMNFVVRVVEQDEFERWLARLPVVEEAA